MTYLRGDEGQLENGQEQEGEKDEESSVEPQ